MRIGVAVPHREDARAGEWGERMRESCKRRGARVSLAAVLLGAMVATASGASAATGFATAIDRSAEFRYATAITYTSFDPHRARSLADSGFLKPVYDGLLTTVNGPNGRELVPELAKSYKVSADGLSISFELRSNVLFQDGTRFNAAAVKANIERAKSPISAWVSTLASIQSVDVVDDTHVVFRLSAPDPGIPWAMGRGTTGLMVSPAALNSPTLATKPVGSGPYMLTSAQLNSEVVYERWDGYWNKKAPRVQRLTISTILDANARYNGLRTGTFDAVYLSSPHDFEAKSLVSKGYHLLVGGSSAPLTLMLNTAKPPLNDVRVRQAISMAVNRKEISKTILQGVSPPAYQPFVEGYVGYDPALDKDPYSPKKSRKLVDQAGATGATISMIVPSASPVDLVGQVLQQALGEIGIKVEILPYAPTEARQVWRRAGHHAFLATPTSSPEASQYMDSAYLGLDNPAPPPAELVTLTNKAKSLAFGSKEREKAYQDVSRYLVESPVHVPIYLSTFTFMTRPNVVGSKTMLVSTTGDVEFRGVGIKRAK
jgi:peptide/nickel transport system substrate-binding protein